MCSFAKFLALGLIASEGHGPVFAEAIAADDYKKIVGADPPSSASTDELRRNLVCNKMNEAHKKQTDNVALTNWTTNNTCTNAQFKVFKTQMKNLWKQKAKALGVDPGLATVDGDTQSTNSKLVLINALTQKLSGLGGAYSFSGDYYTQIEQLQNVVKVEEMLVEQSFVPRMKTVMAVLAQVEKDVLDAGVKSDTAVQLSNAQDILNFVEEAVQRGDETLIKQWLEDLVRWERRANTLTLFVQREKATAGEAVGGVFGVILGLVGLTFAFIMSPCMQCNLETGKTYKNWANGEVDPEWTQMEMYTKAYGDKTPEEYRNEVRRDLGLPAEGKVDSAKASSGALSFVPVAGLMAGAVFVVARRGLNKRRAQKKAKRASRAQEKLHEDL